MFFYYLILLEYVIISIYSILAPSQNLHHTRYNQTYSMYQSKRQITKRISVSINDEKLALASFIEVFFLLFRLVKDMPSTKKTKSMIKTNDIQIPSRRLSLSLLIVI